MKCYQCDRIPMYMTGPDGDIPLCLHCYSVVVEIEQKQLESHERHLNYLSDEIALTMGVPHIGPRFPARPRPVVIAGATMNNISVSNSTVGTINTGSIASVDQSITVLKQKGESDVASALKEMSEAVLSSNDLTNTQKKEIIDLLSVAATEAATPTETRRSGVATTLLERAKDIASLANDLSEVGAKWWPVIFSAFKMLATP